ncbi:MAG: flagellin [Paracoccaceae bacterium]
MPLTTIGDLSLSTAFLQRSTALKQTLDRYSGELSSGQTIEIHKRLGGNYAIVADIDHQLTQLDGHAVASAEAASTATALQSSLDRVQTLAQDLAGALFVGSPGNSATAAGVTAKQAREDFATVVSTLNTAVAGRTIFAGTAVKTTPLADAETILAGLSTALAGLTDAGDIQTAADAWFGSGGGFETTMYQGSSTDLAAIDISETRSVALSVRADAQVFRDVLKETALVALSTDAALAIPEGEAKILRQDAGGNLWTANERLTKLRGDIGFVQQRIEQTQAEQATSRLGLEGARSSLLSVDPYETATRLEDAQNQLRTMFQVFARSSNLRLVNFL